eukprot:m.10902 g.10902  ORF g.10902 m.10902 type:complete len:404 (-) comp8551_c0_seq1:125-1336(-)
MEYTKTQAHDVGVGVLVSLLFASHIVHCLGGCGVLPDERGTVALEVDLNFTTIDSAYFKDCSALVTISIPDTVTLIQIGAFAGCSNLTTVTIPSSVTAIEAKAFRECSMLNDVIVPDSVTKVGAQAFAGCSSLTTIILPKNLSQILGDFTGCGCDAALYIAPEAVRLCNCTTCSPTLPKIASTRMFVEKFDSSSASTTAAFTPIRASPSMASTPSLISNQTAPAASSEIFTQVGIGGALAVLVVAIVTLYCILTRRRSRLRLSPQTSGGQTLGDNSVLRPMNSVDGDKGPSKTGPPLPPLLRDVSSHSYASVDYSGYENPNDNANNSFTCKNAKSACLYSVPTELNHRQDGIHTQNNMYTKFMDVPSCHKENDVYSKFMDVQSSPGEYMNVPIDSDGYADGMC